MTIKNNGLQFKEDKQEVRREVGTLSILITQRSRLRTQ